MQQLRFLIKKNPNFSKSQCHLIASHCISLHLIPSCCTIVLVCDNEVMTSSLLSISLCHVSGGDPVREMALARCHTDTISDGSEERPAIDPCADGAELKEQLRKYYGGFLSGVKQEHLRKRKKGKLPVEATSALHKWWKSHYKWPYPSVIFFSIVVSSLFSTFAELKLLIVTYCLSLSLVVAILSTPCPPPINILHEETRVNRHRKPTQHVLNFSSIFGVCRRLRKPSLQNPRDWI